MQLCSARVMPRSCPAQAMARLTSLRCALPQVCEVLLDDDGHGPLPALLQVCGS